MKKCRAAVVGVGYLGKFHAQKLKAHPEVDLVGVTDSYHAQAQTVAGELQTDIFEKPEQLIGKVDYVHIAAATQAHYELAKLFLSQQVPVLVEKPIASTIKQAQELCEIAEKNNVVFSVGHIERFNPAFIFLKSKSDKIRYLEINRLAPFRVRGSDVSVLHDLTIHDIDLVNWIFGSEINSFEIAGKKLIKNTYDDVSIRIFLKNGTQVSINNSRICPQIVRNYRAVTDSETIFVNTANLEMEMLKPADKDPFYTLEKTAFEKVDALALEADHFLKAVKGEKPPAITGREALKALMDVEKFIQKLDGAKSF